MNEFNELLEIIESANFIKDKKLSIFNGDFHDKIDIPKSITSSSIPKYEALLCKQHGRISYLYSLSKATLRTAEYQYNKAYNKILEEVLAENNKLSDKKIDVIVKNKIPEEFKLAKVQAENAITILQGVISHFSFVSERLKNMARAFHVDVKLEGK